MAMLQQKLDTTKMPVSSDLSIDAGPVGFALHKAVNMASSQQAIIPSKHQVIIDEMMKVGPGDFEMKDEAGTEEVIFGDALNKGAGNIVGNMWKEAGQERESVAYAWPKIEQFSAGNDYEAVFCCRSNQPYPRRKKKAGNITQVRAAAKVCNRTLGGLQLVRWDEFASKTILQCESVRFVTKNAKGCVVYDGTNVQGGPRNCAWLLAWYVHSNGHGNQVYVECGARQDIIAMPDYEIYKKLGASRSSSSDVDADTNTDASAQIEAIATTPRLACVFSYYV